jgi:two-component system, NtrC family, nitrogen regulation response regulator GlnG
MIELKDSPFRVYFMRQILVVDDDPKVCKALEDYFSNEYRLYVLPDGENAINVIQDIRPDLVILDMNLPGVSGMEVLKEIRKFDEELPVIVITGHVSTESAIDSMKEGAYEFITKPFPLEKLSLVVEGALKKDRLKKGYQIQSGPGETKEDADRIIGKSPEIVEIAKLIGQVAKSDAAIIILGESGTGKELAARAIYKNSSRKDKPFLSVNCAALPETLLESELFGHEKGAFTGAYQRKLGKFEQANRGTIFLDEIADMSLLTQSKVLRILQEQEFERVGGNQTIKVDVRIIAATNRSLVEAIKAGAFRTDLFYRLKVVSIYLPPLRERRIDIPLLVDYFVDKYYRILNKKVKGVSTKAMEMLVKYPWPGNIRELENNVHTAIVMSKGGTLLPEHFPLFTDKKEKLALDFEKIKEDYYKMLSDILNPVFDKIINNSEGQVYKHLEAALEKTTIDAVLRYCKGNQVKASEILGISRNTLRDRMKKYNLE